MFQPYTAAPGNEWQVEAIQQLRSHRLTMYDMNGQGLANGLPPSFTQNTRMNPFGIKPFDMPRWIRHDTNFRQRFPPCTECGKDFEAGNTFDHSKSFT